MAAVKQALDAQTILAVTALQSISASATAGWKSVMVDNTLELALDYEIIVKLTTANTAPAVPKIATVYLIPWYWDATNTTWIVGADSGTGTAITSGDAAYTINATNNMTQAMVLNYVTTQQIMNGQCSVVSILGYMPDGFSIIIINNTGAALATGCIVDVKPIYQTAV